MRHSFGLKIVVLAGLVSLLHANDLVAGVDGYICKILNVQRLGKDGQLKKDDGYVYRSSVGESFFVDRTTGKIVGSMLGNSQYREVRVLRPGSTENSFEQIAIGHPPQSDVQYLTVGEFVDSPEKPFWGSAASLYIFSGKCK